MVARQGLPGVTKLVVTVGLWVLFSQTVLADGESEPTIRPLSQTLSWESVPHVSHYEVTILRSDDQLFLGTFTREPSLTVHLPPGRYRWSVRVYDLLEEPGASSPWREITILKAEIPRVEEIEPPTIWLDTPPEAIVLRGDHLERGAVFTLVSQAPDEPALNLEELDRPGDAVRLRLPQNLTVGTYHLVVANPGGLWRRAEASLRVQTEVPQITEVSPDQISLDDPPEEISVRGSHLVEGATFTLIPEDPDGLPSPMTAAAHQGKERARLRFAPSGLAIGTYRLKVTNPAGSISAPGPLLTIRSETPVVELISPSNLFRDVPQDILTVRGAHFEKGVRFVLSSGMPGVPDLALEELSREGPDLVQLSIPINNLAPGTYQLVATNPGGGVSPPGAVVTIQEEKLIGFRVSLGIGPGWVLYDNWAAKTWEGTFLPTGIQARFQTDFWRKAPYRLGVEAAALIWSMAGEDASTALRSVFGGLCFSAKGTLLLNQTTGIIAKIGGGGMANHHQIRLSEEAGHEWSSLDPIVQASIGVEWSWTKNLFLASELELAHLIGNQFRIGRLSPSIAIGSQW